MKYTFRNNDGLYEIESENFEKLSVDVGMDFFTELRDSITESHEILKHLFDMEKERIVENSNLNQEKEIFDNEEILLKVLNTFINKKLGTTKENN